MNHFLHACVLSVSALLAGTAHADIVIGHVLPLSGPDAATGRQLRLGAQAYIDQVNATGGVAGQKVVYVASDDAGQPARTVKALRELVQRDNIMGLLTGANPASLRALAQSGVPQKYRVPVISAGDGVALMNTAARMRQTGLLELAAPRAYPAALVDECRQALLRQAGNGDVNAPAPNAQAPSDAALQGYLSAKVMIGALRLLGEEPVRSEFYFLVRNMEPALSHHLMRRDDLHAGL